MPAGEIGELFMMPPGGQGSTYRYLGAESTATTDGWESLGDSCANSMLGAAPVAIVC